MKKQEFLDRLSKRLEILNKKERDDIIAEYSQHIDMKTAEGQSEEDAIADFGDVDELADEILDAYNLNADYARQARSQEHTFEKKVADKASAFADWINRAAHTISQKSGKEVFALVLKFIVLILVLILLRIPVYLLTHLPTLFLGLLPGPFETVLTVIFAVLINIVYIGVVCYSIYYFVRRTVGDGYTGEKEASDFMSGMKNEPYEEKTAPAGNEAAKENESGENKHTQGVGAPGGEKKKKYHAFTWQNKTVNGGESPRPGANASPSAAHVIGSVLGVILKVFIVIIMIPVILAGVAAVMGLGVSIALVAQGFGIIGIMLIALGIVLCLLALIWAVFKALFGKRETPAQTFSAKDAKGGVGSDV